MSATHFLIRLALALSGALTVTLAAHAQQVNVLLVNGVGVPREAQQVDADPDNVTTLETVIKALRQTNSALQSASPSATGGGLEFVVDAVYVPLGFDVDATGFIPGVSQFKVIQDVYEVFQLKSIEECIRADLRLIALRHVSPGTFDPSAAARITPFIDQLAPLAGCGRTELAENGLVSEFSMRGIKTAVIKLADEIDTRGSAIVVAHSQGTLVANLAYALLVQRHKNDVYRRIRIINVGSAAEVILNGLNLTSEDDNVIHGLLGVQGLLRKRETPACAWGQVCPFTPPPATLGRTWTTVFDHFMEDYLSDRMPALLDAQGVPTTSSEASIKQRFVDFVHAAASSLVNAAMLPRVLSAGCGAPIVGETMTCTIEGVNLPETISITASNCNPASLSPIGAGSNGVRRFGCVPLVVGTPVVVGYTVPNHIGTPPEIVAAAAVAPPPPPSSPVLNDTGADLCFGASIQNAIACSLAEAQSLSANQDGLVGRDVTHADPVDGVLGFSFAVVRDGAGSAYQTSECVRDSVTGLIWEGKPNAGPRAADRLYLGPAGYAGNANFPFVSDYVAFVNSMRLCGFADWRLPTATEMLSTMHYGKLGGFEALVDSTWLANTAPATYWTATLYPGSFQRYYVAEFWSGEVWQAGDITTYHRARLVRSDASSEPALALGATSTEVVDARTGLTWKRNVLNANAAARCSASASVRFNHEQALACTKEHPGWRLPNVKELASIVRYTNQGNSGSSPAYYNVFDFGGVSQGHCWTSTPGSGGTAFGVGFGFGQVLALPRSDTGCVLLVR